MTYLLNNASAATALQALIATQQSLATTQSQLSTGLAVGSAADNAAYWSIAQSMNSDAGALGAVVSTLKQSSSMLSNFNSGVAAAISVVNNIKNDIVSAQAGGNLTQIQSDIAAQQNALLTIANGAAFNGQNWLNGTVNGSTAGFQGSVNLAGGYTSTGGISNIAVAASSVSLFTNGTAATAASAASGGILAAVASGFSYSILGSSGVNVTGATGASVSTLNTMLSAVNNTITSLETAASTVGSAMTQVNIQQTFVSAMQTNLTNGAAALVDADMNTVSTRLQALQVQQQLGVQALAIANQSAQMILKLFQ